MTKTKKQVKNKKMGLISLVGMLIAGIMAVDTFAVPAAAGFSVLGLWIIVAIFFMIPNGFINAELGSRDSNGLISWIKHSVGEAIASIMGFFYWVNVSLWMPAVFIALAMWINKIVPGSNIPWYWLMIIALAVNWIIVFVVRRGISFMKVINNISSIVKVFLLLWVGILGVIVLAKNGTSNTGMSVGGFFPNLSHFASLTFVSTIVFNLLGFELISSIGEKVKRPKKNIPWAIIIGVVMVGGLYIFGTLGVLSVLPIKKGAVDEAKFDLATAMPLSLHALVEKLGMPTWIGSVTIVMAIFALGTTMLSWISGASEVVEDLEYASDYKVFSKRHPKYDTLSRSYILMGLIASFFIILGFIMQEYGGGDAFWTILSLSIVVFIIPYLFLTPAIIIYRNKNLGNKDAYKIWGGKVAVWIMALLDFFFIGLSLIMLFTPYATTGLVWLHYLVITVGLTLCTITGFILYKRHKIKEKYK